MTNLIKGQIQAVISFTRQVKTKSFMVHRQFALTFSLASFLQNESKAFEKLVMK